MKDCGVDREITAKVCQKQASSTSQILESAKASLLYVCNSSHSLYLLGYSAQPFRHLDGESFETTVCVVPLHCSDEVCWPSLQYGRCCHGVCRWQRPEIFESLRLRITIQLV